MNILTDQLARPLQDLRISVTDRCNFRCRYCMPREVFNDRYHFMLHEDLLTYEEIARIAGILLGLGVRKVRLTGGEPLVRRDIERLVSLLAPLPGLEDLTLTTNGALLAEKAASLRDAGLQRITVSLDSLDDAVFAAMTDTEVPVSRILDGIRQAVAVGLSPVKVNMVVQRGVNDDGILEMARHFRGTGITLRFIEYMDVGTSNGWQPIAVFAAAEIISRIDQVFPLEPIHEGDPHEVARRYRYRDGAGEIGVIASVTQPFCGGCTRLRLSSEGRLYTCLFASGGHDIRAMLRGGASDYDIAGAIETLWKARSDQYSQLRFQQKSGGPRIEMWHIGG